tara:strand:+ start:160 stop:543 length:384 start_codon:yes stop_codon:yes gene_type:complete
MNKLLVEKMRRVYTNRLLEALKEVDVLDKEGNVLISKDLKVVHKDSGYEYTVDDVVRSADGISFVLREPDEPRFDPASSTDILDELTERLEQYLERVVGDDDSDEPSEIGDVFIVDEESFEKEYEVK